MVDVERRAIGAVEDSLSECPRVRTYLASNDKTPVTDGHVDLYRSGDSNKNADLLGRVAVQVKGRVVSRKLKQRRVEEKFPVDREVLQFLERDGGGLYFFVAMDVDGKNRQVYYAALTPFKARRYLGAMREKQKTVSVKLQKLPSSADQIAEIVGYAIDAKKQVGSAGFDESLLSDDAVLEIRPLTQWTSVDKGPVKYSLEDADYIATLTTAGGLTLAVDIDFTLIPSSYAPRSAEVALKCGGVAFSWSEIRQVDADAFELRPSEGLVLRVSSHDSGNRIALTLGETGGVISRWKDLEFFVQACQGAPIEIDGETWRPDGTPPGEFDGVVAQRDRFAQLVELLRAFSLPDEVIEEIDVSGIPVRAVEALHSAFVRGGEVPGRADGVGRYDFELGEYKVITIVTPGESAPKLLDPFDPASRSLFRIYRLPDSGEAEEITDWGSVYEATTPTDLAHALNLRLEAIVAAYAEVPDNGAAHATANYKVLHLLVAADMTSGARRTYLLNAATRLCDWLDSVGADPEITSINRWQVLKRLDVLGEPDLREIRAMRRRLTDSSDKVLREICLLVLLGDFDEVELALEELTAEQIDSLSSWPIWALYPAGGNEAGAATVRR